MHYSTIKSIYPRANMHGETKDNYMRAFLLSNELSRLEHEKKMAARKISTLEKRIDDVRNEINSINSMFGNANEIIESDTKVSNPKKRHVTIEY